MTDFPKLIKKPKDFSSRFIKNSIDNFQRQPNKAAPLIFLIVVVAYIALLILSNGMGFMPLLLKKVASLVQIGGPFALLAIGSGLVIATGEIDLSNASVAAFCGVLFVCSYQIFNDSSLIAFFIALAAGALIGMLNGYCVAFKSAPSLIVTWAIGLAFTILAVILAKAVSGTGSAASMSFNTSIGLFGFGHKGFNFILGAIVLSVSLLLSTSLPKKAMAVGADSQAAAYIGIRPKFVRFQTFLVSGLISGLAGVIYVYSASAAATTGIQQNSLVIIAICVLGGTLLSGGYFSVISIMSATMLWCFLDAQLQKTGIPFLATNEAEAIEAVFGLCVLMITLLVSKQLSGPFRRVLMTRTIDE